MTPAPRKPPEFRVSPAPVRRHQRLRLRLAHRNLNASGRLKIESAIRGLPVLIGSPISVRALPQLSAHHGKLLSGQTGRGKPVHAASFIRRREIVLEQELLRSAELPHIVVHEVFHFVWARLGNANRAGYAALLAIEQKSRARGELGESAAAQKHAADYVCESFCDTAAWLYAPGGKSKHATLGKRWRASREAWFKTIFAGGGRC